MQRKKMIMMKKREKNADSKYTEMLRFTFKHTTDEFYLNHIINNERKRQALNQALQTTKH